jgi:hypothetical protein
LAILKDLQDSGQQATIIGHFAIQLGHNQDVTNIDNVREQPETAVFVATDDGNRNIYTTEHGLDNVDGSDPASSWVLPLNLIEIIAAWPNLPDSVQAGISAMVKATSK